MSPRRTPTRRTRCLRLQHLIVVALLVLFPGQLLTGRVYGAGDESDPYDVLYDVIMTRYGPDGNSYAENEASPAIAAWSDFPFGDSTYKKFNEALDGFAAISQAKLEAYSDVKRALLQRHLWEVFDTTFPFNWGRGAWQGRQRFPRSHLDRRVEVQPKISSLIQRLALTEAQIRGLPNTMAVTVKSGGFAQLHDPKNRLKPFLPADLFSQEGSWICVGEAERPIPASVHTRELHMRSTFLPFMRLPGGRTETLSFLKQSKNRKLFPVGTKVALAEQAFLISDDGDLILSPLIVSIQLRAYLDVDRSAHEARPEATQCVAEFVMQPRELFKGNAIMKAINPRDHRFGIAGPRAAAFDPYDPFGTGETSEGMPTGTRLNDCMRCHGGKPGVRTRSFMSTRLVFKEGSPDAISKATIAQKKDDKTWKKLRELWRAESAKKGVKSPAQPDPPQPPPDSKRKPEDRRPAKSAVPRSEFDELYEVLMVRRARNGVAYGDNETAPMIFAFSRFPFDDATYPRLTAAINAITPEAIRTYSKVQRAILQRQLWALFDETAPSLVLSRRVDEARRAAVQKQLADMIRQLALTRSEIESLPDTLHTTVKAKKYPIAFDLDKPIRPFLPADIIEDSSGWVFFGRSSTPVNGHAIKSRWRSSFFQLMRLPGERTETSEYMRRLELLRLPNKRRTASEYINALETQKVFPPGTQVALIERAFLVSDKGELVLSPMTVGIQLRAYRNVEQSFRDAAAATQCVTEFISRPRDFMRGDGLMTAILPTDYRLKVFSMGGGKQDVLELVNDPKKSRQTRLQQCMQCHGGTGIRSLGDVARSNLKSFAIRSRSEIVKATADAKRNDESWKLLKAAWANVKR